MMKESTMHMIIIAILLISVGLLGKLAYDKMQKNKAAEKKAAEMKAAEMKAAEEEAMKPAMKAAEPYSPINPMDRSLAVAELEIPSATPSKEYFRLEVAKKLLN
jgi:Tfp pilus assembly protein PilV